MKTIWKFVVDVDNGVQELLMPADAQILTVHEQGANICLWAMVDSDNPIRLRHFVVHATGHSVGTGTYIGTAHINGFVWHVFEVTL